MLKIKTKKTLALSLILASAVAVSGAAIALGTTQTAYAADYTQELDGSKVFYTGIRGAEITYSPVETQGEETHAYTMFKIGEDETVEYRQNLAYSWRTSATDSVTFSMEIGFANTDFERYVIKFQSQQHLLTKESVTENFIVFTPSSVANTLEMSVVQELDDDTANYFGGSVMCEDCLDENTCFCNHCGERIWNDDNIGEDDRPLCEHCYNNHYTRCCNCDALLHNDDAYYDDDEEAYCCDCFHERADGSIHYYC